MPTVVITTDQFEKLAKTILKAKNVPDSIMVLTAGNPEFISHGELQQMAKEVMVEAVAKLTGKTRNAN